MLFLSKEETDLSVTLDAIRFLAALAVAFGHALSLWGFQDTSYPLLQNIGVIVFFALSGFLIAYVLVSKTRQQSYGFLDFCIERTAGSIAHIYQRSC